MTDDESTSQSRGCTLESYARAKRLPADFLKGFGLTQISYSNDPAVRMPYRDRAGNEKAARLRTALTKSAWGDARFRWVKGAKPFLYGLDHVPHDARDVVLVEGESDVQTLHLHGVAALGVPGAASWSEERDAPELAAAHRIYVVLERDSGGDAITRWLAKSSIRDRVQLIDLESFKDPSELHIDDPSRFKERWREAIQRAIPWRDYERKQQREAKSSAWAKCKSLASEPRILDRLAEDIRALRVVGEDRLVKVLFLALTSRVLDRPISTAVKGPSSSGKSFAVEKVLSFFPRTAYYTLTAMSDRALAYGDEPLAHRVLVIAEADGMDSDFASYLLRSLLSEGRLTYDFVEKTTAGLHVRRIEREGPTGLLVTTTRPRLHAENETRLLSLTTSDTADQTRKVLHALAEHEPASVDLSCWHALQEWIALDGNAVVIPFAKQLAEEIPPISTRLRRDFRQLLSLIATHAILHQATRKRDKLGRIVAIIDDYAVVRELVADLVAEGVEATVPETVLETVRAVAALTSGGHPATKKAVASALRIDTAAAWRRIERAIQLGYVRNDEERPSRPAKLLLGDPLPRDITVLPSAASLGGAPMGPAADAEAASKHPDPPQAGNTDCPIDRNLDGQATPSPMNAHRVGGVGA